MNGRIPILVDGHEKSEHILYELIAYDMGISFSNLISFFQYVKKLERQIYGQQLFFSFFDGLKLSKACVTP